MVQQQLRARCFAANFVRNVYINHNACMVWIEYGDERVTQITLDGNFSNDGRNKFRRGNVPVLVIGVGSEQPKSVNSSTKVLVASNVFSLSAFESTPDLDSLAKCVVASDWAALAYDKQVRPSWSVC